MASIFLKSAQNNRTLFIVFFILFVFNYSCQNRDEVKEETIVIKERYDTTKRFSNYLKKVFKDEIKKEEFYYILISSKFCPLCQIGLKIKLDAIQNLKLKKNIKIITDYAKNEFNVKSAIKEITLYDTLSILQKTDIPQNYITLYKTSNYKVEKIIFISDSTSFLKEIRYNN